MSGGVNYYVGDEEYENDEDERSASEITRELLNNKDEDSEEDSEFTTEEDDYGEPDDIDSYWNEDEV